METAEAIRHTQWGKETYKKRAETIERVFADAKEKHGLRYTTLRGKAKVTMQALLTFACMNLKKLAIWKSRDPRFRSKSGFLSALAGSPNVLPFGERKSTRYAGEIRSLSKSIAFLI